MTNQGEIFKVRVLGDRIDVLQEVGKEVGRWENTRVGQCLGVHLRETEDLFNGMYEVTVTYHNITPTELEFEVLEINTLKHM